MHWKSSLCMSGQLSNTLPCARAPPACTAAGREQSALTATAHPQPAPVPSRVFAVLCSTDLPWLRKTCKENEIETFLTQPTPLSQRRTLLHFTPFSARQRRKVLEEQDLSSCEISKSNDKHMEVCPARAHPPVQILGQVTWCLASSFKRALFIYSSQEFGTLFFNLPTSFTSSCSACSPRAFFFAINTPSSGWLLH